MNTSEFLKNMIIRCGTTCGCGNQLIEYSGQVSDNEILLTCDPYSEKYGHSLLIRIDKNSKLIQNAGNWNRLSNYGFNNEDFETFVKHIGSIFDHYTHESVERTTRYYTFEKIIEALDKRIEEVEKTEFRDERGDMYLMELKKIRELK